MSNFEQYDTIINSPNFTASVKKKANMLWILMIAFLIYYFALLVGAAYFRPMFATILFGNINLGMVFAISQYAFAGAIALYYAHYMKHIDQLLQKVATAHHPL